jgi:hypothetical protein
MVTGSNVIFYDVKKMRASANDVALMLELGDGHSVTIFMDDPNLTHHIAGAINVAMMRLPDEGPLHPLHGNALFDRLRRHPCDETAAYAAEYSYRRNGR